jgi:hypothetical protein
MADPARAGQLPIEALEPEQLADKRSRRSTAIQLLQPDTAGKRLMVKMAQQLLAALTVAEDALIGTRSYQPEEAGRQRWLDSLKLQRKVVTELGDLLSQLRLGVELGEEAVDKIFHVAAGYDDMSEEQKKMYRELLKEKEKTAKEQELQKKQQGAQELAQQAAARHAADIFKWPAGRGRGWRQYPYFYGP